MKQWYSADSKHFNFDFKTHTCIAGGKRYCHFIENGNGFAYYEDGTTYQLTYDGTVCVQNNPDIYYPLDGCPFNNADVKIKDSQTWEQSAKNRQNSIFAQIFGD